MDRSRKGWTVAMALVFVGCGAGSEGGSLVGIPADAPTPRALDALDAPPAAPAQALALADGLEHIANGRFTEAVACLAPCVEQAPDDPQPVLARGVALVLSEKVAEGRRDVERAYRLSGRGSLAARLFSFALRMQGDQVGAMKVAVPGYNAFDRLLLETGDGYGALAFAGPQAPAAYVPQATQAMDAARRRLPLVGQLFVKEVRAGGEWGSVLYARGVVRLGKGDWAGAEADLGAALETRPDEPSLLARHAEALVGVGRAEEARKELSIALSWKPALVEGYARRAIAAARMGNGGRARSDLAIARQLDGRDKSGAIKPAAAAVEAALKTAPRSAPDLLNELLDAARQGAPPDQLTEQARAVVRASNAARLLGDEVYQERRRVLEWAVRAGPEDPDRLADLGHFLVEELDVRSEMVVPYAEPVFYRTQTKTLLEKERDYARDLFDRALKVKPDHAAALVGTAALKMRDGLWADAETTLKRVMAMGAGSPRVLEMMSKILRVAAGQKMAKAASLRLVHTWTEHGYDVIYHYTRYPSAAELAMADAYEQQAQRFLKEARQYLKHAVEVCKGTPAAYDYEGQIAWQAQDYQKAYDAWKEAVRLAPGRRDYRYSLANACAKLNRTEEWLEETTRARCLEQTTASAFLQRAWSKIANHAWQTVDDLLVRGAKVDAGDPRIAAFRAAAAEGQEKTQEAVACYRAALAMEMALDDFRRNLTPETVAAGRPIESFAEVGRIIALRNRIGQTLRPADPAAAAGLFLANVALEPRFSDWALSETVRTAVLPDPARDLDDAPRPPLAAALLKNSRALAAMALAEAGRHKEALEHFALLDTYEARRQHAGGVAYLEADDPVGSDPATWLTAAESCMAVGDPGAAMGWLGRAAKHYDATAAGRADPSYARYQAIQKAARGPTLGSYKRLRDEAVAEIQKAGMSGQNAVSERWEARLRPLWQTWMRAEGVPPPREDFADVMAAPFLERQHEALREHQERARQTDARREADRQFRQWVNSEVDRIRRLPQDQQQAEFAKLQEAIRRYEQP